MASSSSSTSFSDVTVSLERRLASIHDYSLIQLRECKGPISMHADLVNEIRQDMNTVESQLEELALLAEDQETEQARRRVMGQVDSFQFRVGALRQQIREATLSSKRRIETQSASAQREELFKTANKASASIKTKQSGATSKEDELMSATANVTDGLRRTRQLMEQELEKSSLSAQMLERSSQTLTLTTDQYTSFNGLLQSSKQLITSLEKADSLDRILIIAALVFFALVCLLIIKRRVIDRGVRAVTLVGRVAGGVGGAATKGIKAVAPSHVKTALRSVVTAEAATVLATASSIASAVLSSHAPLATDSASSAYSVLGTDVAESARSASTASSVVLSSYAPVAKSMETDASSLLSTGVASSLKSAGSMLSAAASRQTSSIASQISSVVAATPSESTIEPAVSQTSTDDQVDYMLDDTEHADALPELDIVVEAIEAPELDIVLEATDAPDVLVDDADEGSAEYVDIESTSRDTEVEEPPEMYSHDEL